MPGSSSLKLIIMSLEFKRADQIKKTRDSGRLSSMITLAGAQPLLAPSAAPSGLDAAAITAGAYSTHRAASAAAAASIRPADSGACHECGHIHALRQVRQELSNLAGHKGGQVWIRRGWGLHAHSTAPLARLCSLPRLLGLCARSPTPGQQRKVKVGPSAD